MKFSGKVILVTGGSRGLGYATAKMFLDQDAKVTIIGKSSENQEKAKINLGGGKRLLAIKGDVSQEDDVKEFTKKTIEKFGKIDVLVNCAGVAQAGKLSGITLDEWNRVFGINVTGTFLVCREVAVAMAKRKIHGRIINVASVLGQVGGAMTTAYSASKAAVIGFTKALAKELAPHRINVNCVSPGAMDTDMYQHDTIDVIAKAHQVPREEIEKAAFKSIPLGRILEPSEVARVILFLAGEEGSGVTGRIWEIACGYEIH